MTRAITNPGVDEDELGEGAKIADYVVRRRIGYGGFANVYLAEHEADGSRVALKVLRRHLAYDQHLHQRFVAEIRMMQTLQHPNIVKILDFGVTDEGCPFFVMELLIGTTVAQLLSASSWLDPLGALEIFEPVCAALELAHTRGIIHRDVTPSNVMVVQGPPRTVKLLDFGIAKILAPTAQHPRLTHTGVKIGTPSAMAPEQIRCQAVDERTDVYALGVFLYRLLVGVEPFQGDEPEVERLHLQHPPPRPSARTRVPQTVDEVVLRCMAKAPVHRYPGARAVLDAYVRALGADEATAERQRTGLVLCVLAPVDGLDPDDGVAHEALLGMLEAAEAIVREAGIPIAIETGNGFVAVQLVPEDERERGREYDAVIAVVRGLCIHASGRSARGHHVSLRIGLHLDRVIARRAVHGDERPELPIMYDRAWMRESPGVFVSEACRSVLRPDQLAQVSALG